jgi:hypothetical protein
MKFSYETPVFTSRNPGFHVCGLQFVYDFAVLRFIYDIPTFPAAVCAYDVTTFAVECRVGTTLNENRWNGFRNRSHIMNENRSEVAKYRDFPNKL